MTTQDFVDWALAQRQLNSPHLKLALVALALKANTDGGGKVTLGYLVQSISCPIADVVGFLAAIARHHLIVFTYRPCPSDDDATQDEIEFGLFANGGPAS